MDSGRGENNANTNLTDDSNEDIYSGFNEVNHPALDTKNLQGDSAFQDAILKSSYGRRGQTGRRQAGPSRMGTAGFKKSVFTPGTAGNRGGDEASNNRPITAVRGAGYTSSGRITSGVSASVPFDPLDQGKRYTSTFQSQDESTPEFKIKQSERKVNALLVESILAASRKEYTVALDKAKEAAAKEKQLNRQKERYSSSASSSTSNDTAFSVNNDLTFSVLFNLALQYSNCEMYIEANNLYSSLVKNRSFANAEKLKLNIGVIYFLEGNYSKAIKFFRMALDQVPNNQKEMRMKIMKNVGLAFIKLNQYTDAITSFEYIMSEKPDHRTALHLIVCHYAVGDKESMKKTFNELISLHTSKGKKNSDLAHLPFTSDLTASSTPNEEEDASLVLYHEAIRSDPLSKIERSATLENDWCILMSSKLIAPVIMNNLTSGYEWTVETIRSSGLTDLANELEIDKAVKHLKKREFKNAIATLKSFEKKDSKSATTASTNLAFMYLLQNDIEAAQKYSNDAIQCNRYNSGALVNKGCVEFKKGDFLQAREFFREALSNDATCIEALYNLLLTCKKTGDTESAIDLAYKLNVVLKNHPLSTYQMAHLHEITNDTDQSLDWYQKLLAFVPTDCALLNRLSDIADAEKDKHQSFNYLHESFRYFPAYIPTIERLAAHHIENQAYEKAIGYLEKASSAQPNEIKWSLMVAACYRRGGNYQSALSHYIRTHNKFPDNVECLKLLIKICTELKSPQLNEFIEKLRKIEKNREMAARKELRSSSRTSKRSAASSREGSASSNSSGYMTETSRINSRKSVASDANGRMNDDSNSYDLDEISERPTTSRRRGDISIDDFAGDDINDLLPE